MAVCSDFRIAESKIWATVSCQVSSEALPSSLEFRVPVENVEAIDIDEPNWAPVALLYPSMMVGEDLEVRAPISGQLLHALQHEVQALLLIHDPRLKRINVISEIAKGAQRESFPTGVATGFSAGVDSFATLHLFGGPGIPEDVRISHLTVFDVGAMGHTGQSPLFRQYKERCDGFAKRKGLKILTLGSNLDDFFDAAGSVGHITFQGSHTLRNASAALVFGKALSHYLCSSAINFPNVNVSSGYCTSDFDPILLPLLNTGTLMFRSAGAELSRVEKTELISDDPDAQVMLDVCVGNPDTRSRSAIPNCSVCWKCTRTLLTLEAIGKIDDFKDVFDLTKYRQNRSRLVTNLMATAYAGEVLAAEAMEFAKEKGVELPWYPLSIYRMRKMIPFRKRLRRLIHG